MSAQAGVYYRENQPALHGLLSEIGRSLRRQGPDGGDERQVGPVGFAFRAAAIEPDASTDCQPLNGAQDMLLTWDGRLDNRDDLMLQVCDSVQRHPSDAAIVLSVFERWREDAFPRIIGDWALAAWVPQEKTLYLSRDFVGTCPLYYTTLVPGILLWSSELEELATLVVKMSDKRLRLEDRWIAGYLAIHPENDVTPFAGILPVPPGHFVMATSDSLTVRRHWLPDPGLALRYRRDAEYEEHFRELFRGAVRCRLRSARPVWAHLSGGLDSSSIVCMADDILEKGQALAPRVETITSAFDASPESDECRFVASIEAKRHGAGHYFKETDYPLLTHPFYHSPTGTPEFIDCFAGRERAICAAMEKDGARVQISGQGGDELLGNIGGGIPNLVDRLHRREWTAFWGELGRWSMAEKRSRAQIGTDVIASILPVRLQTMVCDHSSFAQRCMYINDDFSARFRFRDLLMPVVNDPYGLRLPSERGRSNGLLSVINIVGRTVFRRMGTTHVTYPCLHRPLVQFLLSIPFEQLYRPGETRSLMRRALRQLLPREILRRRSKRSPDSALYRALNREWPQIKLLLTEPLSAELGYISKDRLNEAAEVCRHGAFPITILLRVVCLEAWLRIQGEVLGVGCYKIENAVSESLKTATHALPAE